MSILCNILLCLCRGRVAFGAEKAGAQEASSHGTRGHLIDYNVEEDNRHEARGHLIDYNVEENNRHEG